MYIQVCNYYFCIVEFIIKEDNKLVKQRIQHYFINKRNGDKSNKAEYVDFGDITKVAVLFDYTPSNEKAIRNFIEGLSEYNISSSVASYSKKESGTLLREDFVNFGEKDLNVIGNVKDSSLIGFLGKEYDVLFDLRDNADIISDFVHSKIRRKFSVGNNKGIETNDITITDSNDINSFTENIIDYLRNLKKA